MQDKTLNPKTRKRRSLASKHQKAINKHAQFSPAWVVENVKDATAYHLEVIEKMRTGVKKTEWKSMLKHISSTEKEFESILPTSISSMQKKEVYNKDTSERIYELARLFGLGSEIFDSIHKFKSWLSKPSKALNNKAPFVLLDSSLGFQMVESELVRIKYNVYS